MKGVGLMINGYFRGFVALGEEQSGFSLPNKKAFGKVIIEARGDDGKLLVSIQGLKPTVLYKIYLVAKSEGTASNRFMGVCMGNLPLNDKGVADVKILFNAANVCESKMDIGLFSAVAVIVHDAPVLTAPLVGYINEPFLWKNGFEFFVKPNESVVSKTNETEQNVNEKFRELVKLCKIEESEPKDEVSGDCSNEIGTEEPQAQIINEPETGISVEIINELFQKSSKIKPFSRRDPNIEWIRIAPEHVKLIGLEEEAESPFMANAFNRYRHLVMGRVQGGRYILGVPDMYTLQTAATAESKGFAFKRCDGGELAENSYGYWVMVV